MFFVGEYVRVKGWPMVGELVALNGTQFIVKFDAGMHAYGNVEHLEPIPVTRPEIIVKAVK